MQSINAAVALADKLLENLVKEGDFLMSPEERHKSRIAWESLHDYLLEHPGGKIRGCFYDPGEPFVSIYRAKVYGGYVYLVHRNGEDDYQMRIQANDDAELPKVPGCDTEEGRKAIKKLYSIVVGQLCSVENAEYLFKLTVGYPHNNLHP